MEREDYEKKIRDIQLEVLDEIRNILGCDKRHKFKNKFLIDLVGNTNIVREYCHAVEVWYEGMVVFCVSSNENSNRDEEEIMEGEDVFNYSVESFLDILSNLKREIKEEKLEKVKDFAQKDGMVWFGEGDYISLSFADGKLSAKRQNGKYTFPYIMTDEDIDEELDSIIAYIERQTKKKFMVRVCATYSRTWEIEASNYQEAEAQAAKELKTNPLSKDDLDGEDWGSWEK